MSELSDAEVFGPPRELSDADVFGNAPTETPPQTSMTAGQRASLARRGVDTSKPSAQGQGDASWSDVGAGVTQAGAGFNEGLASTVGRALDVVPYFANRAVRGTLGAPGDLPSDVHPVENTFRKYFVDQAPPPQTSAQRALRAGGDMVGQNVVNLVPGEALANSGIRSGVTLAEQAAPGVLPKIRGAADSVLDWIAENPVKAARTDTMGAFEAGAGGQVGQQYGEDENASPNWQRFDELMGQFAAPAGAALWSKIGLTPMAVKAGSFAARKTAQMLPESVLPEGLQSGSTPAARTADRLSFANREGNYADPAVPPPAEPNWVVRQMDAGANARQAKAADVVHDELTQIQSQPEAAANTSIAETLKKSIPGFAPGVAKETGDPALLNLQQRLESNSTGDELRGLQQRYDQSAQSLRDKFASLAPPVEETKPDTFVGPMPAAKNPQDVVVGAAASKSAAEQAALLQQQGAAQSELRSFSASLPDAERADAGARLRDLNAEAERASDARTSALRNNIASPNTKIEVEPAKPAYVNDQMQLVPAVPAKTMTVNEMLDRRAAINQELRQYNSASARTVDDVKQMGALQAERSKLDEAINGVNQPGMSEYRAYYRDQHVPDFEEGASRDIGLYDRFGYDKNKVPDEQVLAKFGGPNNISAAKQFTRIHGDNPEAVQLMADHQLGRLKAEALDPVTGALKAGAVDKFLAKNRELLDALPPQVRESVAAKNPDAIYAKLADLEQRQRAIADDRVAQTLKASGGTPEKVMTAALNDWQIMRDLKAKVAGNTQAEAALTRAVMDKAPDVMDAKAFSSWLDGKDRVLRQVITPQHLQALKGIAKAAEIQTQLPRPTGTAERPKNSIGKAADVIGTPVKSLLQRILAVKQGRVGAPYTAMDIGTRFYDSLTERETDAIWKEALFNPKVAETIAQAVKNKGATRAQFKRLHNYLLTVGAADTGQDYPYK